MYTMEYLSSYRYFHCQYKLVVWRAFVARVNLWYTAEKC